MRAFVFGIDPWLVVFGNLPWWIDAQSHVRAMRRGLGSPGNIICFVLLLLIYFPVFIIVDKLARGLIEVF